MENSKLSLKMEKSTINLNVKLPEFLEIERQKAESSIREKGIESSFEIINNFETIAEKWVEEDALNRIQVNRRLSIVNFYRSYFYLIVGNLDDALDCIDEAIYMARQEGFLDLVEYMELELSKLNSKE